MPFQTIKSLKTTANEFVLNENKRQQSRRIHLIETKQVLFPVYCIQSIDLKYVAVDPVLLEDLFDVLLAAIERIDDNQRGSHLRFRNMVLQHVVDHAFVQWVTASIGLDGILLLLLGPPRLLEACTTLFSFATLLFLLIIKRIQILQCRSTEETLTALAFLVVENILGLFDLGFSFLDKLIIVLLIHCITSIYFLIRDWDFAGNLVA